MSRFRTRHARSRGPLMPCIQGEIPIGWGSVGDGNVIGRSGNLAIK